MKNRRGKEKEERERERERVEENKKIENFYTNVSGDNIFQNDFSRHFRVG
jgi:hypothetical protein